MTDEEGPRTTPTADDDRAAGGWLQTLKRLSPWGQLRATERLRAELREVAARLDAADRRLEGIERRMADRSDRTGELERRSDRVETAIRTVQDELAELRDRRAASLESRLDGVERAQARMADEVVPAVVDRGNLLVDRLAEEIEEVASLVERILLGEPLPAPPRDDHGRLAAELAEVQPVLLAAFRGAEEEIGHRLQHHLPALAASPPVLDLGCGRGELLVLLRETGVEARGVERDPALAQGARRRGLEVVEGDVLEVLGAQPGGRYGAVTAIHVLEHLEGGVVLRLLAEVHRVLRPGGILIAECPNPHSLRVGAALFWQDPTHARPLLPETLELYLRTSGFTVEEITLLHPFPEEQRLAGLVAGPPTAGGEVTPLERRVGDLARRLDEILNGPRDFAVVAAKPQGGGTA